MEKRNQPFQVFIIALAMPKFEAQTLKLRGVYNGRNVTFTYLPEVKKFNWIVCNMTKF